MKFEDALLNKKNGKLFLAWYSLLFFIISVIMFSWYFFTGRNFIWHSDGFTQHYSAYIYYGRWLRSIVKNLFFNHNFSIPTWDFNIGYGSDVIKTLCYYVIGDPFCFPLIFIPDIGVQYYYNFSSLFRIYCAGLSFFIFCKEFDVIRKKNIIAIFAGVFTYIFYYYAFYNVARHPFFLNPLIFYPLVIAGVERIIQKKTPSLFVIAVSFSAISNFYFFYMIVILTILYGIVREIEVKGKDIKKIFIDLGIIFLYALLGVCISASLVIPSLFAFLGDSRFSESSFKWLYSIKEYLFLPFSLYTFYAPKWTTLAFPITVVFALFYCLYKKNSKNLRLFIFICFIILLFPFLGQVLNGLSYVSNRWNWAFALLLSFILCYEWDDIINLEKKDFFRISCVIILFMLYSVVSIMLGFSKKNALMSLGQLCVLFFFCFFSYKIKNIVLKEKLLFCLTCGLIVGIGFVKLSDYSKEGCSNQELKYHFDNEAYKIRDYKKLKNDNSFNRYTERNMKNTNISLNAKTPGTQFYWSLSNPEIVNFYRFTGIPLSVNFCYKDLDYRSVLNSLCAVKYFYKTEDKVPFGFTESEENNIYTTENCLPFAFCYDEYIGIEDIKKLDFISKQEVFLQKAVLEKKSNSDNNLKFFNEQVDFKISSTDGVQIKEKSFIVQKKNASITISIPEIRNKELYIVFNGLHMEGNNIPEEFKIQFLANNSLKNNVEIKNKNNSWYMGLMDFTVCLGYIESEQVVNELKIIFNDEGSYKYDLLSIFVEDVEESIPLINKLKTDNVQNIQFLEDEIRCDVSLEKDKILMLNIPYEKGWTAYVNGVKQEILKCNVMFSALELPKGRHNIVLKYHTPGMILGNIISLFSLMIFIILRMRKKL
ncbi:MAG: YfhO family protein [Treponema sp.]|nr:YfhO family protein [Treponema sp.]